MVLLRTDAKFKLRRFVIAFYSFCWYGWPNVLLKTALVDQWDVASELYN